MAGLEEYRIVPGENQDVFLSSEFQNISEVRKYFNDSRKEKVEDVRFDAIDDILSFYSQLVSDNENEPSVIRRCKNAGKDIPVPLSDLYDYCANPDVDEAPYKLIVKIANDDTDIVRLLIGQVRKVLRRDRQLVPIGRLQQIDNSCIRWLARQPGYTAKEKAGARQKLMGVVRFESADTLENRVFKQYMKYCLREGRDYIRRYRNQYPDSENCRKVARFVSLVSMGLETPSIQEARDLSSIPSPNYTLQNNRLYREIWKHYLLLARHISEIELIWKNRHSVLHELVKVLTHAVVDYKTSNDSNIVHEVWLRSFPGENGCFVTCCSDYHDFDRNTSKSTWISDINGTIACRMKVSQIVASKSIDSYYVPSFENVSGPEYVDPKRSKLVYIEKGCTLDMNTRGGVQFISPRSDGNLVVDIYDAIQSWFSGRNYG